MNLLLKLTSISGTQEAQTFAQTFTFQTLIRQQRQCILTAAHEVALDHKKESSLL